MRVLQVAADPGIPLWVVVLSAVLSSGVGVALFKYLEGRLTVRANQELNEANANLTDVTALNAAISGLAGENKRLTDRVAELERQVAVLRLEVEARPTRKELLDANGKLRKQLLDLGVPPINGHPPEEPKP